MIKLFNSNIGRLRIIGILEGISLLILVFIAVPLKYKFNDPSLVKGMGPIHGALFLLFVVNSISIAIQRKWHIATTLKVLLSCIIPFGTFYTDHYILKPAFKGTLTAVEQEGDRRLPS